MLRITGQRLLEVRTSRCFAASGTKPPVAAPFDREARDQQHSMWREVAESDGI